MTLYGNIDVRQVQLAFRVGGRIADVFLDEGDSVGPGTAVARLDDAPYKDTLHLEEARLEAAAAVLQKAVNGPRAGEVEETRANVAELEAMLELAEITFERSKNLWRSKAVSKETYAQALAARNVAEGRQSEGRETSIQVLVDGTDPNTAKFVQNYARDAIAAWSGMLHAERETPPPRIAMEQHFWFNPELESRNFLIPGAIVVVMTIVGTLLTSLVIAREWERGTMEAVMATPVTAGELLMGKIIPHFLLGMFSVTVAWGWRWGCSGCRLGGACLPCTSCLRRFCCRRWDVPSYLGRDQKPVPFGAGRDAGWIFAFVFVIEIFI